MQTLRGLLLTAIVGAVAWFAVGRGIYDDISARSGGGKSIVRAAQFRPVLEQVRARVGVEARVAAVTMRPSSVEFEVVKGGRARGYRWRRGEEKLQTYEVGGSGAAGEPSGVPFPISRIDPSGPERLTRRISAEENGDFELSIADMERADTGRIVWIMRGRVGERGIAWWSGPDGRRVKPYTPRTRG